MLEPGKPSKLCGRRECSMRNPKFQEIRPNYRKSLLEITLREGRRSVHYTLPFSSVGAAKANRQNRFARIKTAFTTFQVGGIGRLPGGIQVEEETSRVILRLP